jgi:hypothetical protein
LKSVLTFLSRVLQERRKERKKEKSKYTHFELEQALTPTPQSRYHPLHCSSINDEADAAAASRQ